MQLTTHFSLAELACRCGCGIETHPDILPHLQDLAHALEALRQAWGRPISPTCGVRCAKHNAAVGGAPGSKHLIAIAADLATEDQIRLAALATQIRVSLPDGRPLQIGGIGLYPGQGFVHVDLRPRVDGRITTWAQIDGHYQALPASMLAELRAAGALHV